MLDNLKKNIIVTGHYGCGKTNFSVNLAMKLSDKNKKVTVADLDIVNPYFRSADFSELFRSHNIELAAPMYANTNLDIPAISFDLEQIASEIPKSGYLIADVGGDDSGATVLGRYAKKFLQLSDETEMVCVVNMYRYLTSTPEEAVEFMREIQNSAGMKHTSIVNNSNLGEETTAEIIEASVDYAEKISKLTSLPLLCTVVPNGIKANVPKPFESEIYVKKIWET